MSIAVLTQVYSEARRLMIAGSVVARGDFRLKKLLPPLEQAGKQAPVFAKVAETAKAVIEGPEETSAASLLELTSLVTAVLYTQGETGLAGKLEPVETVNLGGEVVQIQARLLKPLLAALTDTGSGRLELIREAYERGQFRDIRLIKPALAGLDDPYSEVGEFIEQKVLPTYGRAILPELRAKYDVKGTKGHPRRLRLMFSLDPEGSRELVKDALENGSKDVKVAAISCLGADPSDLPFLIEQAAAKSQDIRAAAYRSLTRVDKPEAIAVLEKALAGKDYQHAANAIEDSTNPQHIDLLVAQIHKGVGELPSLKEKKKVSEAIERILHLLRSFPRGDHAGKDEVLLELFEERMQLNKLKGDSWSGSDISEAVIQQMAHASKRVQMQLVNSQAELTGEELEMAFEAGRFCLTAEQQYEIFSPYLQAKVDDKKKAKDPAWAKREAIIDAIESRSRYYYWLDFDQEREDDEDDGRPKPTPLDPRWLDLAVNIKRLDLVNALARLDHPGALAFVKAEYDAALKKAKNPDDLRNELIAMFRFKHPDRADAFFAGLAKRGKKTNYYFYWFIRMVPHLPKESLPRLEEMVAGMPEAEANHWIDAIQELRTKTS